MISGFLSMYVVYALVFALSSMTAFLSQSRQIYKPGFVSSRVNKVFFLLSFLIPWIVIGFTRIGVDYDNYALIISRISWDNLDSQGDSEYGFNFIAMVIKSMCGGNEDLVIFFLKTMTIAGVYAGIYSMRDQVSIGYSVMFYLLMMYLPSFYLISQCFAASMVLLVMVYYMKKRRELITIGLLLLLGLVHNSVFLLIPFFLISVHLKTVKFPIGWLLLVFIITVLFADIIFKLAQTVFEGFHYESYMRSDSSGSGLMLYARTAIMMLMVYLIYKSDVNYDRKNMLLYFAAAICLFGILGRRFDVISRMEFNFIVTYVILISSYLRYHLTYKRLDLLFAFILLFMFFRGFRLISSRIGSSLSMMSYYIPFNPFM